MLTQMTQLTRVLAHRRAQTHRSGVHVRHPSSNRGISEFRRHELRRTLPKVDTPKRGCLVASSNRRGRPGRPPPRSSSALTVSLAPPAVRSHQRRASVVCNVATDKSVPRVSLALLLWGLLDFDSLSFPLSAEALSFPFAPALFLPESFSLFSVNGPLNQRDG